MIVSTSRVTPWHAALFFQIFDFMIALALAVWYGLVATAPNLISEYLPAAEPADLTTILGSLVVAVLWVPVIYFMWKQKKVGLVASIAYSLSLLILVLLALLSKSASAPDFSDLLFFPVNVLIILFSLMAYRSSRQPNTTISR